MTQSHTQSPLTETHPIAVAERIYRVRLPLPFALNHVNCYLLQDDEGWTMLDTGLHWPAAVTAWQQAFTALNIAPHQIHRILLTHMHPDHFGLAGYFQALTGAPVLLSTIDAKAAHRVWVEDGWKAEITSGFWQRAGVENTLLQQIDSQVQGLRRRTMPHPHHVELIEPGARLQMAGNNWRAIHAPGHSDGQLIFYAEAAQIMLCGDQILGKITPNIGRWPGAEPQPLQRYLQSLTTLQPLSVQLALPGHGAPLVAWAERIAQLQAHHQVRLAAMADAAGLVINGGASALTIARAIFNFAKFSEHEVRFAVAETLAHLEYLVAQGELEVWEEKEVCLYGR